MKLVWNDSMNGGVTLRPGLAAIKEKIFRGGGWDGAGKWGVLTRLCVGTGQ